MIFEKGKWIGKFSVNGNSIDREPRVNKILDNAPLHVPLYYPRGWMKFSIS